MKRTPLKPGKPPRRATAIRARNPKRLQKRYQEAYGMKASWVRAFPCTVWWQSGAERWAALPERDRCAGGAEAAHVKSRGAGGTSCDMISLCNRHHHEQHSVGVTTFAAKYDLDLPALAAWYEAAWQRSGAWRQHQRSEQ